MQRFEAHENDFATRDEDVVYVLKDPLFERPRPPLPGADEWHRVPSGYWKAIATQDGRMTAFVMETDAPRTLDHCAARQPRRG